jgi:esterase/lipase superfamily enzyme
MNERYIRWWTPHMSREFEMLAFGDGGGIPLVLFPTAFGRHSQNKDFGLTGAIAGHVDSGKVTIYCPDSIDLDSFYNKAIHPADRMRTHNGYERVITHRRMGQHAARIVSLVGNLELERDQALAR